jgi:serine O-acetyltransferase
MEQEELFDQIGQFKKRSQGKIPSPVLSQQLLKKLIEFLFPILCEGDEDVIPNKLAEVNKLFTAALLQLSLSDSQAQSIINEYNQALPSIYSSLKEDATAIYQGDPAAESIEEVVVTYPGFYTIIVQRLAHQLYKQRIPILPRLFTEYAHGKTGIDIHPGAQIGHSFCIDHGTGIVIGETAIIGNHVKIYQGVTLGALSVSKEKAGEKRHPTIEDFVTIYAGATILGGKTVIGHDSIIGGNVWLTDSIEPYSLALNKSDVFVKNKNPEYANVIDFVI